MTTEEATAEQNEQATKQQQEKDEKNVKLKLKIQEKMEDVLRLWLNNESAEDILPVVDELFELVPIENRAAVLSFLPSKLCAQCFIKFLEDPPTKRTPEIAKQYISIVDDMKFDEPAKRSAVYLQMYKSLNPVYLEDAHRFLVKYLSTFSKVDDTADVEGRACEAVLNCLKLPIWKFDEVMDLVTVRGLRTSKNSESKQLLQLLELFCHEGYNAWMNFYNDNKQLIEEKWELDPTALTEKIRLLSLCRMAHNRTELNFSEIASVLSLNEDEVENMIVRTVANKLMEARVDQVDKKVTISYSHHSLFTTEQWRQLQETLTNWKDSVAKLKVKFDALEQK